MNKRLGTHALLAALIAGAALTSAPAQAGDALMDLLEVLRDKGTLSDAEYRALTNAALEQEAGRAQEAPAPAAASSWTDTLRLKGDMRLRYERTSEDDQVDRVRGRLRYRLGAIAEPAEHVEVGAGLASGSSDPRSTNQTFTDTFSSKPINLDYAYVQYRLNDYAKAISGKFKMGDYLYRPTDLIWDSDINPEGLSVNLARPDRFGTAFANTGVWVLNENANSSNDPHLLFVQVGQNYDAGDVFATVAGTWYDFRDITSLTAYGSTGSNTDYHFGSVYTIGGEWGVRNALGRGVKAALVGEWVYNDDTSSSRDTGYAVGARASRNAWSFTYLYADLEANAWPDIFPDSDRFNGFTGIDGHEFIVEYALMKNVTLGLDYYNVDNAQGTNQDLLQLDVVVGF